MTNKKKGGLSAMLVAITSLAIFITMFIAILLSLRGCDGRLESDSLEDVTKTIQRVQATPNAIETTEIFIRPESMIIAYFPEHQNIITKYAAQRFQYNFGGGKIEFKDEYIFPPEDKDFSGTFQETTYANFLGYVKRRASDCPTNNLCICECTNIYLTTHPESIYASENAFINCGSEECTSISNVNTPEKIYLKDFLTYSKSYEKEEIPLTDEDAYDFYPPPDTFYWEGGFILLKSQQANLGKLTKLCFRLSQLRLFYTFDDCSITEKTLLEGKRSVAGHLDYYAADYFNLRIKNTQPDNKIVFEII